MPKKTKSINLALQGGGSHGAFTWGVLDRLLQDERIEIEAMTGTSAGAMNGLITLYGLLSGGREEARELLDTFWHKISHAGAMSPIQPTLIDRMVGQFNQGNIPSLYAVDFFTNLVSPYQYNPLGINPLRNIVEEMVDFEMIRDQDDIKLFVNATNVRTGKIKVFSSSELTLDMVMASACLPSIFQTVEIDGEPYWDGGYSGNPAIYPLFYHCSSNDVVVVQINPINVEEVPKDAASILDRVNEISFNATLMREMRAINFVSKLLKEHKIDDERYRDMRLHRIEAEDAMNDLSSASKMNVDWNFLVELHDIGFDTADSWIKKNYRHIEKTSSINIDEVYL